MLQELLSLFRPGNPLNVMVEQFAKMLDLTSDMTITGGEIFFGKHASPEERTKIYKQDVKVNKLERSIRKLVVAHLSVSGNNYNLPYCLALMSLVKDVERIGDYAKNLSEVVDIHPDPLPEDEVLAELREIRVGIEESFREAADVLSTSDHDRALELIRRGKDYAQRCDGMLHRIAHSSYDPGTTTAIVLGVRYYKRIGGHLINVLSSVVMPLHKLDYYDEDEIAGAAGESNKAP